MAGKLVLVRLHSAYPLALHLLVVFIARLPGGPPLTFFASESGSETLPTENLLLTFVGLVLVRVFLRGIGEATGWRGFALPLLQDRWSPVYAGLVVGVVWALWHVHRANFAQFLSLARLFALLNMWPPVWSTPGSRIGRVVACPLRCCST